MFNKIFNYLNIYYLKDKIITFRFIIKKQSKNKMNDVDYGKKDKKG